MNTKHLLILCLALIQTASSRPRNQSSGFEPLTPEPEVKVREKRKYQMPFLTQLVESGVGVKRIAAEEEQERDKERRVKTAETGKESEKAEKSPGPEVPAVVDEENTNRVKKQSPNNIGGCGKTACGPVVSARGVFANDMREGMQGVKTLVFEKSPKNIVDASSKPDQFAQVQGRTFDTLMGITPVSLSGYGSPAYYASAPASAPADAAYGHSFFKPQPVPTLALVSHQPSHSLLHPMLLPHLMPHLVPHLVPGVGSYFAPHRLEPVRVPESADLKQPLPPYPQPSYVNSDNTLLCTPFRNQRLDAPYDYFYKPDSAFDKSLNVTDSGKKSSSAEEEKRVEQHMKKVNEIKEEIGQLNRAAQRIVDQQERLTQMQQKQLWGGSGGPAGTTPAGMTSPYMGAGYYAYPGAPWGYSRSNILSYPNTHDDIEFFLNLLRVGKKFGLFSESLQPPSLAAMGNAPKGAASTQKGADLISEGKTEDKKSNK